MSTGLTIKNLIQYFNDRNRQMDQYNIGRNHGKEPQYPMLVVFLGESATKGYKELYSNIFRNWPQYQQEIKFVEVQKTECEEQYYSLDIYSETVQKKQVTIPELNDLVSSLFSVNNHFQDKSKLIVYFVLDTTDMLDERVFLDWLTILDNTKNALGVDKQDLLDMLIVLLNESLSKQKTARRIRNYFCVDENKKCISTFILSNRRSDNAITENWEICYKMIASLIALSNNNNIHVMQSLFAKGFYTASYARSEKPIEDIGQVTVNEIIDRLSEVKNSQVHDLLEEDNILLRLGITKEGYFKILNDYVDKVLVTLLPSGKQVELFPRRSMDEFDMSSLSAKEISEETMGAWDAYLAIIVQHAQEKVNMDATTRVLWAKQYAEQLHANFTAGELVYLKEHLLEVKDKINNTNRPLRDSAVLSFATLNLKYLLSSNLEMIKFFVNIIEEEGNKAMDFVETWNVLLSSRMHVFSSRDENITKYYSKKVRNYFDYHEVEFVEEFKKLQDSVALEMFLKKTIDQILKSDAIFYAPFEEELESRMKEDGVITLDSKQYIRQKLTGEGVHTYLQINFSYGNPIFSAILLKTGTALHSNLKNNLSETIYYYDTGCGDCAEAINIYELQDYHLINDEGR